MEEALARVQELAAQDEDSLRKLAEENCQDADADSANWKALIKIFQLEADSEFKTPQNWEIFSVRA